MSTPPLRAYLAGPIALVLVRNRDLMRIYKEAAREERIQAVAAGARNYVVIHDPEVAQRLQELAPELPSFAYDPETGEVAEPAGPRRGRGWKKA